MWKLKLYEIEITHTHTHTHTLHPIPDIDHHTDELHANHESWHQGLRPRTPSKKNRGNNTKNKTKMRACGAENN